MNQVPEYARAAALVFAIVFALVMRRAVIRGTK